MDQKSQMLLRRLRDGIVSGSFPPGSRLPSQRQLSRQCGVSTVTVHTALKALERDGFVMCDARRGYFVTDAPPHLSVYGLVYWNDPRAPHTVGEWSRYSQAISQAATEFEAQTGRRLVPFYGIRKETQEDSLRRLTECVENQRLAGLIFVSAPLGLAGSPILETPGIPRVALASGAGHPNVRAVALDREAWMAKAFRFLVSEGRQRVAALMASSTRPGLMQTVNRAAQEQGFVLPNRWIQFASLSHPQGASHAAELLMADRERPDALLITDDHLVEPALAGLSASGVRVPEEVTVVAHANWPYPPAKTLPVRLLGYDLKGTLQTCVELIDQWREGSVPPELTRLSALWEEELPQRIHETDVPWREP